MSTAHPISFRGVYVFTNDGDIVFSQRFNNVEARVPQNQQKIPPNAELIPFIKEEIIPSFVANLSKTSFQYSQMIHIVAFQTKNFYLSVIPLIESPIVANQPPIEISASYTFLSFFDTISKSVLKQLTPGSPPSAFASIRQLVTQVLPFGTPVIHDVFFASQLTTGDVRSFSAGYQTVAATSTIPSWKTYLVFPRAQLELKLRECVMGSIDGQNNNFVVYGEVKCIASITYLPDITVNINGLETMKDIASHFCIKSINGKQIVFSPPTGITQLLLWKSPIDDATPPVDGVYAIKEDSEGLHFSLTIGVRAPVKKVTVHMPFTGRGCLTKHQFQNPSGQLRMSKKEATMMWICKIVDGPLTLTGTLNFENPPAPNTERCKAFVSFKSKKKSFTGTMIEKESITSSSSSTNFTIAVDASYSTENKKYIFWSTPMQ